MKLRFGSCVGFLWFGSTVAIPAEAVASIHSITSLLRAEDSQSPEPRSCETPATLSGSLRFQTRFRDPDGSQEPLRL